MVWKSAGSLVGNEWVQWVYGIINSIIIMLKRSSCGEQRQRRLGNKNQFDSLLISSHTSKYLLIERTRCPTLGAPITMIHHIVCLCRANELLHCWSKMTYEGSNNSIWGMLQWVKVPFDMVLPYRNYVHASLARGWFVSPKEERNECHTPERGVSKDNPDKLDSFGSVLVLVGVAHVWLSCSFEFCRSLRGRVQ